ncbi:WhiB family transcriptional regulator [Nocardia sp. NPDC050630]|uniref:WhiB family transcriptional regulator n=1 Tax=Nocardia sp. NPDC050630 TaxID=3364321 RepID=UPI0037A84869
MAELPPLDEIRADAVSEADKEKARIEVARRARNAKEAAKLLAMLGLDGAQPRKVRRNNRQWPSDLRPRPATPADDASQALQSPAWMDRAACKGDDPELWHPVAENDPAEDARITCTLCPVLNDCGKFAADNGIEYGIWAGYRLDDRGGRRALLAVYGTETATATPAELELVCTECAVTFTTKQGRTRCRPCELGMPSDTAAREHIAQLRACGATVRDIAVAADLAEQTIREIANGSVPRIRRSTNERILAVTGIGSAVPAC